MTFTTWASACDYSHQVDIRSTQSSTKFSGSCLSGAWGNHELFLIVYLSTLGPSMAITIFNSLHYHDDAAWSDVTYAIFKRLVHLSTWHFFDAGFSIARFLLWLMCSQSVFMSTDLGDGIDTCFWLWMRQSRRISSVTQVWFRGNGSDCPTYTYGVPGNPGTKMRRFCAISGATDWMISLTRGPAATHTNYKASWNGSSLQCVQIAGSS